MPYFVYILYSDKNKKFYIGSCEDLSIRLTQHNSGRNKSTHSGIPWHLKYFENYETRKLAVKREMEIKKKKSRQYIESLIQKII
jgi:putative endonuclease